MSSIFEILPAFKDSQLSIPYIRLKSIKFEEFKAFKEFTIDFTDAESIQSFNCLIGPNGCGKSTILDSIQLIFSRFEGFNTKRLDVMLGKLVRHVDGKPNGIYGDDDFLLTAQIECSLGNYEVQINKNGFIKDHPEKIKMSLYRLCFYARFDQELRTFQLEKAKWPIFKKLYEAVTGFTIEEIKGLFDDSDNPVQSELLKKYVLSFNIHKPDEIIHHTECSSGERKIIKAFSTLLNKEYNPQIILIDNVAMHVESGRHLELIECMKACFPDSQIFTTTHSYHISRNFGNRKQLYDLRFIKESKLINKEQWRLYLIDELKDCIAKLQALESLNKIGIDDREVSLKLLYGEKLISRLKNNSKNKHVILADVRLFMKEVVDFFITDVVTSYTIEKD